MITLKGITWDPPRGYDPLAAASKLYEEQFGVKVEQKTTFPGIVNVLMEKELKN